MININETNSQLDQFISEHKYHTISIEMVKGSGLISGIPDNWSSTYNDKRLLGMDKRYIKAVYCCGKVCK